MRKRSIALALIAAVIVVAYVPQIPGCVRAQVPKSGRVIDRATGAGLADAAVIVTEQHISIGGYPVARAATSYSYRAIVKTDSNGFFRTESHFFDLAAESFVPCSILGWRCEERIFVTAYKPGWIVSDDVAEQSLTSEQGKPHLPHSVRYGRYAWFDAGTIQLEPIAFDLDRTGAYYLDVTSFGLAGNVLGASIANDDSLPAMNLIRQPGHEYLTKRVCELAGANLSGASVKDATVFVDAGIHSDKVARKLGPTRFVRELSSLAPDMFDKDPAWGSIKYKASSHFSADTVCELMRRIGVQE